MNYHGLRLSADGRTMYVANIGNDLSGGDPARRGPADPRRQRDPGPGRADPKVQIAVQPPLARGIDPAGRPAVHPQRPPLPARGRRVRRVRRSAIPRSAAGRCGPDHRRRGPEQPEGHLRPPARGPPAGRAHGVVRRPRRARARCGGYTGHYCSVPYAEEPADRRLLDDQLRPADLRHQQPRAARARSPTSTDPTVGSGSQRDGPARVGREGRGRSGSPTPARGFFAVKLTNGVGRLLKRNP